MKVPGAGLKIWKAIFATCRGAIRPTPQPATSPAGRGRAAAALISVCLGFFVIQLDVTIVNVALPAIQREIGGSLAGLQWVVDAYTLALAAIMLTAGSTADRIGAQEGVHPRAGRVRDRLGGLRGRPGSSAS